jgi:hypothetical protein
MFMTRPHIVGPMTKNPAADPGWLSFDIHGRVRVGVAKHAPTAAQLCTMFADFLTDESDGPFDLTVTGETQPVQEAAYAEDAFSYTPSAICLRTPSLQIIRDGTNVPTFLLRVPVAYDADHASDVIVEQLAAVTTPLGVSAESGS